MTSGAGVPSEVSRETNSASRGFRVCLTVSGLRCASEGAPLERALKRLDGVRDASVNALRDRISLEVDRLVRLEAILRILGRRGYSVDTGEVRVTAWIGGAPEQLLAVRKVLLEFDGVSYCRVSFPTGRLDLALTLDAGWEEAVRKVCDWLCDAAASGSLSGSAQDKTNPIVQDDSVERG